MQELFNSLSIKNFFLIKISFSFSFSFNNGVFSSLFSCFSSSKLILILIFKFSFTSWIFSSFSSLFSILTCWIFLIHSFSLFSLFWIKFECWFSLSSLLTKLFWDNFEVEVGVRTFLLLSLFLLGDFWGVTILFFETNFETKFSRWAF